MENIYQTIRGRTKSPRTLESNSKDPLSAAKPYHPLVSHFRPRRHACLRSFPAIFAGRRAGQRWGVLPPPWHQLTQLEAAPTNPSRLPGRWGRTTFGLRRAIAPVDFCFGFCCLAHFAADQLRPKRSNLVRRSKKVREKKQFSKY